MKTLITLSDLIDSTFNRGEYTIDQVHQWLVETNLYPGIDRQTVANSVFYLRKRGLVEKVRGGVGRGVVALYRKNLKP